MERERLAVVALALLAAACGPSARAAAAGDIVVQDGGGADATPRLDAGAHDAGGPANLSVLFVGNSYTFVNDLPGMLRGLAATAGEAPSIAVSSVTAAGATLDQLWSAGAAPSAIAAGGHAFVVLQEQSVTPVMSPAYFAAAAGLFSAAAHDAGAKPAFYETWARADGDAVYAEAWSGGTPSAMQDGLLAAYESAAADGGGVVVPVGEAWRAVREAHPSIALFQSDGSHPTAAGTYLAACVFYDTLAGHALSSKATVPSGVAKSDATTLRAAAAQAAGL